MQDKGLYTSSATSLNSAKDLKERQGAWLLALPFSFSLLAVRLRRVLLTTDSPVCDDDDAAYMLALRTRLPVLACPSLEGFAQLVPI